MESMPPSGDFISDIAFLAAFFFIILATIIGLWWWLSIENRSPGLPQKKSLSRFNLKTIDLDQWSIRYHISGSGPYVILIHGIGANLFCWRDLVAKLEVNYTVVALDLPGFGQSSKLRGAAYGLDAQIERLATFFKALSINSLYLVGNSMGGNLALWFTLKYPDQVRGMSLIAPATHPGLIPLPLSYLSWLAIPGSILANRLTMRWAHLRTVSKKHLIDPERIFETAKTYGRNPSAIQAFLSATEVIRDRRLAEQLLQIQHPVQILWGSKDQLVSRKVIDKLEQVLPNHESHVHLGGGHHLQEDEPEWVAEKIDTFFAGISSHTRNIQN